MCKGESPFLVVVIPGRISGAALCAVLLMRTRNPEVVNHLWIPGSRENARPGMTVERFYSFTAPVIADT
jgi:hypothetical protein